MGQDIIEEDDLSSSHRPIVRKLAGLPPDPPPVSAAYLKHASSLKASFKPGDLNASGGTPKVSVWLEAWSDPVAGLCAYTPCVHTCNLFGDNDWRLVVADEDRKLKVRDLQ